MILQVLQSSEAPSQLVRAIIAGIRWWVRASNSDGSLPTNREDGFPVNISCGNRQRRNDSGITMRTLGQVPASNSALKSSGVYHPYFHFFDALPFCRCMHRRLFCKQFQPRRVALKQFPEFSECAPEKLPWSREGISKPGRIATTSWRQKRRKRAHPIAPQ